MRKYRSWSPWFEQRVCCRRDEARQIDCELFPELFIAPDHIDPMAQEDWMNPEP